MRIKKHQSMKRLKEELAWFQQAYDNAVAELASAEADAAIRVAKNPLNKDFILYMFVNGKKTKVKHASIFLEGAKENIADRVEYDRKRALIPAHIRPKTGIA